MTQSPQQTVLGAVTGVEPGPRGPLSRTMLFIRLAGMAIAIAGAIPTAMNLYYAWQHDIPYNKVSHRLAQYNLWLKNVDCKIDYRALNVSQGLRVDAGSCPKSGDIALKISTPDGRSTYEWVAFGELQKPTATSSLLQLLIGTAHAADRPAYEPTAAPFRVAQASGMQVVCQAVTAKSLILRIVNESGKCFRETISPIQGKVEKREEVPCNTQCPAPGKG
jgi:hypothetical protein